MMYDGTEYQATWRQKGNNTSKEGKKDHYMKRGFWLDPKTHFWESDSYTDAGKKHCREWIKTLRPEYVYKNQNLK